VWTGGASFSHIDLTMETIRQHAGENVAKEVANRTAVDRDRSQSDYRIARIERDVAPEAQLIESGRGRPDSPKHAIGHGGADVGQRAQTPLSEIAATGRECMQTAWTSSSSTSPSTR
jgi:hypothetical protein